MALHNDSKATLLRPDADTPTTSRRTSAWTLPADLQDEAVRRVRTVALVYAAAYTLAGPVPALLTAESRAVILDLPTWWIAPVVSIVDALLVAWLMTRPGLTSRTKLMIGLAFEVLGSYGIAASEYDGVVAPIMYIYGEGGLGLSWVAVWVMLFTIVVPAAPRMTLLAAALSLSGVPVMFLVGDNAPISFNGILNVLIIPYLVVLLMAYVGARVVYRLGTAVTEAREMGSYRLVERLGKGGMGEVWRARHRMLARPAAIKLIRPEVLGGKDPSTRELLVKRFEREAQATALMRSAHTMELYDFGVTDDGTFYYVMELLDGFDLDDLVARFGPVPPERAVHLLRQVCDSLAEAHEAGLIHRDVKPANLYVCRYGREVDFIKVLDFGLVKHGSATRDPDADRLTGGDVSAGGTPAFMSPEQAMGDGEVDARSDIYAVGCVAYWLLTGSLVFKGSTPMETIVLHVTAVPEPLLRRAGQHVPEALERLVMRCLAKDPADRPQSAEELAADLDSLSLADAWTPLRAREWWDEHRPASTTRAAMAETA